MKKDHLTLLKKTEWLTQKQARIRDLQGALRYYPALFTENYYTGVEKQLEKAIILNRSLITFLITASIIIVIYFLQNGVEARVFGISVSLSEKAAPYLPAIFSLISLVATNSNNKVNQLREILFARVIYLTRDINEKDYKKNYINSLLMMMYPRDSPDSEPLYAYKKPFTFSIPIIFGFVVYGVLGIFLTITVIFIYLLAQIFLFNYVFSLKWDISIGVSAWIYLVATTLDFLMIFFRHIPFPYSDWSALDRFNKLNEKFPGRRVENFNRAKNES